MNGLSLLDHISIIKDPRQPWKVEHTLSDITFLTITAVIAGAEGWEGIEDFGEDNIEWLQQYGDFSNGIPVHDTVARVMGMQGKFTNMPMFKGLTAHRYRCIS